MGKQNKKHAKEKQVKDGNSFSSFWFLITVTINAGMTPFVCTFYIVSYFLNMVASYYYTQLMMTINAEGRLEETHVVYGLMLSFMTAFLLRWKAMKDKVIHVGIENTLTTRFNLGVVALPRSQRDMAMDAKSLEELNKGINSFIAMHRTFTHTLGTILSTIGGIISLLSFPHILMVFIPYAILFYIVNSETTKLRKHLRSLFTTQRQFRTVIDFFRKERSILISYGLSSPHSPETMKENMETETQNFLLQPWWYILKLVGETYTTVYELGGMWLMVNFFSVEIRSLMLFWNALKSFSQTMSWLIYDYGEQFQNFSDVIDLFRKIETGGVNPMVKEVPSNWKLAITLYITFPIEKTVSLVLELGKLTIISGETGVGKTTLLKIIAGSAPANILYSVKDDVFHCLPSVYITGKLGIIIQTFQNVKLSWREYVCGNRWWDESLFWELAKVVCIEPRIRKNGNSYNTMDVTSTLSNGELQRLGLLKALYQVMIGGNVKIIILDEVDDSLDIDTSQKVIENINKFARVKNLCMVVVSHHQQKIDGHVIKL
jgi:ABC-type cobalamin/Fe3+-siderophores transport system ATPase subunit